MFFDDEELTLKKHSALRVPPPIPDTDWKPPQYFPNLSDAAVIGFDCETKELDFDRGPGWSRGKGHIVGVSVAARSRSGERGAWYFPVRHEVEPDWNLSPEPVFAWLQRTLNTPTIPKVGANLIYDIGWLTEENVIVSGELNDVQYAEKLLDEEGLVNLDFIGGKYIGTGKDTNTLYQWLAATYGGSVSQKQRENIWRAPPRLVGSYAEQDASLPIDVFEKQYPMLVEQELLPVFRMENRLTPLIVKMRQQGVRVDLDKANQLYATLANDVRDLKQQLFHMTGVRANVSSGGDLAKIFDTIGIEYPRTEPTSKAPEGNPSFQKEWLKAQEHPVAKLINDIREYEKIRGTFLKSYILENNHNGIIHCSFHPMKGDTNGAKTGRFASSDPNLQNIPVRTEVGKKIRKLFTKFEGHHKWRKKDYSQIEYRMLAHYACDRGDGSANNLRAEYNADPKTDYHNRVMISFANTIGKDLSIMDTSALATFRKPIKNVNFGLLYGQTEKALAYKAGMTPEQAKEFFAIYHQTASYVKPTMEQIEGEVQQDGCIRTIMGRKLRFDAWEPMGWGQKGMPLPYEQALARYGAMIRRAMAYRGVNYKFQGSAAEIIKAAMIAADEAGIFDVIGVPLLQVHDELDFSVIDDSPIQQEAYKHLDHLLENTIKLRVPIKVDTGDGENWGEID